MGYVAVADAPGWFARLLIGERARRQNVEETDCVAQ